MSDHTRYKFTPLFRIFTAKAKRPPVNLREAFKKAHHLPKVRPHFSKVVADRLKQTFSKPSLTLTPSGARSVRGAARVSVALKNIDVRKLPDTRPFRQRPVRQQFKHTAGRRDDTSNGRGR